MLTVEDLGVVAAVVLLITAFIGAFGVVAVALINRQPAYMVALVSRVSAQDVKIEAQDVKIGALESHQFTQEQTIDAQGKTIAALETDGQVVMDALAVQADWAADGGKPPPPDIAEKAMQLLRDRYIQEHPVDGDGQVDPDGKKLSE